MRAIYLTGSFCIMLASGCGSNHAATDLTCGPGTVRQGNSCLPSTGPVELSCGAGTHQDAQVCLPDASALTCGAGTERQDNQCVALLATAYDLRTAVQEIPADGYSQIPVLAFGRQENGLPATEAIVLGLSRPNAGALSATQTTLIPMGAPTFFTPCDSSVTPACVGSFSITLALASAPSTPVAASWELTLVEPTGVGTPAACMTGGNVLFVNGEADDPIHPGLLSVSEGTWQASTSGGAFPNDVTVTVAPENTAAGALWSLELSTEALTEALQLKVYDQAERAGFAAVGHPGLDVHSDSASCNTLTGRFQVFELATGTAGALTRLTATFEQYCEGGPAMLSGCVHYRQ